MKRAALLSLFFTISLVCRAGGATLSKNEEPARDAAVQWLQIVDAGRYDEAASQGSTEVRSFDQWREFLPVQRASLGRLNKRELIEMKHRPTFPAGFQVRRYYVLRFKASFEHHPGETEEIVLAKIGCCWEVFGYKISDE